MQRAQHLPATWLFLLAPCFCTAVAILDSLHPCALELVQHNHGFVSTCGRHGWVEGDDVTIYACVPRVAYGSAVSFDPVSRAFGPEAVVGRVFPVGLLPDTWDEVYPVDFESRPLLKDDLLPLVCLEGIVSGLRAGAYNFSVVHEFSNWLWDPPWNTSTSSLVHFPFGSALDDSWWATRGTEELIARTAFKVTPKHVIHHQALPDCTSDLRGRWIRKQYVPISCTLRRPSYEEFGTCMAKLNGEVRVYGDSHSRRAMKALFTKGSWCTGHRNSRPCMCEDNGLLMNITYDHQTYENGSWVSMRWMTGARAPLVLDDIAEARVKVLVIGGLSAWSVAGEDFSTYVAFLEQVVQALQLANATALIFRNAPAFCCTLDTSKLRRYTSKRDLLFNRIFQLRMRNAFPDALWWDTRAMTEARPLAVIKANAESCVSNHMDSQLVEDDLSIFMHFICKITS